MTDRIPGAAQPVPGDEETQAEAGRCTQEELDDLETRAGADFLHDRPVAEATHVYRDGVRDEDVDPDGAGGTTG